MLINLSLLLVTGLNVFAYTSYVYEAERLLEVKFLDVGQGDSFLVRTPDKVTMLVDSGRDSSVISRLKEQLRLGENVDILLSTHPDGDHVTGFAEVIKQYNPSKVIYNHINHPSAGYTAFLEAIRARSVPTMAVIAGDSFNIGCCVRITFLWPGDPPEADVNETNPYSIAIFLEYAEFSMYAGADLPIKEEELTLKALGGKRVDILKVGHHGSKTSTSLQFLQKLQPALGVIQLGKANTYGHPHAEVLSNLSATGTRVLRNDLHGTISFYTNGHGYKLITSR